MGCNAWNHAPGCNCGWGGQWYGNAGPFGDHPPGYWQSPISRSTVNASCPVCGAGVFFYKSPYGGRVFFDDLGPPWPKHPCTDRGHGVVYSRAKPPPRAAVAKAPGWLPMFCEGVERHEKYPGIVILKLAIKIQGRSRVFAACERGKLDHRTPFLYRLKGGGELEISTLEPWAIEPPEIRFPAWLLESDLPDSYRSRPPVDGADPANSNSGWTRPARTSAVVYPAIKPLAAPTTAITSVGRGTDSKKPTIVIKPKQEKSKPQIPPKPTTPTSAPKPAPAQAARHPKGKGQRGKKPLPKAAPTRPRVELSSVKDEHVALLEAFKSQLRRPD